MDQIVVGIRNEATRQKLWVEDDMGLEKALKICRAAELAEKQMKLINEAPIEASTSSSNVNKVNKKDDDKFDCQRCGTTHGKKQCPAFNKKCDSCGRLGHFSKCCGSKSGSSDKKANNGNKKKSRKVNMIEDSSDEEKNSDSDKFSYNVSTVRCTESQNLFSVKNDKWSEILKIGNDKLKVNLDTGAECSVISRKKASDLKLKVISSVTKRLTTYNNNTPTTIS